MSTTDPDTTTRAGSLPDWADPTDEAGPSPFATFVGADADSDDDQMDVSVTPDAAQALSRAVGLPEVDGPLRALIDLSDLEDREAMTVAPLVDDTDDAAAETLDQPDEDGDAVAETPDQLDEDGDAVAEAPDNTDDSASRAGQEAADPAATSPTVSDPEAAWNVAFVFDTDVRVREVRPRATLELTLTPGGDRAHIRWAAAQATVHVTDVEREDEHLRINGTLADDRTVDSGPVRVEMPAGTAVQVVAVPAT